MPPNFSWSFIQNLKVLLLRPLGTIFFILLLPSLLGAQSNDISLARKNLVAQFFFNLNSSNNHVVAQAVHQLTLYPFREVNLEILKRSVKEVKKSHPDLFLLSLLLQTVVPWSIPESIPYLEILAEKLKSFKLTPNQTHYEESFLETRGKKKDPLSTIENPIKLALDRLKQSIEWSLSLAAYIRKDSDLPFLFTNSQNPKAPPNVPDLAMSPPSSPRFIFYGKLFY